MILDWMKELIGRFANWLLSLLPHSPFKSIQNFLDPIKPYLGYLNWFVPVNWILGVLTVWLTAVATFYLYSIIMRWVKMIGD